MKNYIQSILDIKQKIIVLEDSQVNELLDQQLQEIYSFWRTVSQQTLSIIILDNNFSNNSRNKEIFSLRENVQKFASNKLLSKHINMDILEKEEKNC